MAMNIDKALDTNEGILQAALEKVNRRIETLIVQLESENGRFITTQLNLDRALRMRVEIAQAYAQYNAAVEDVIGTYRQAAEEARSSIGVASLQFSASDTKLIDAMIADTRVQLMQYGTLSAAEISNQTYLTVASGGDMDELLLKTKQLLVGGTDVNGKPLTSYAKTIASTNYMNINHVVNKRLGDRIGADKWKYTGTLIQDSRPFCMERAGNVYTTEEVDAWNKLTWQGKAGDVWVTCGGWNCRHVLRPYIE